MKIDEIGCYEYSDSDRDILISILIPHILNRSSSDEEDDGDYSHNDEESHGKDNDEHSQEQDNNCLSFADLENQSFLELIDLE